MSPAPAGAEKNSNNVTANKANMLITETRLRVRYAETDQMGFCYYGNYAKYYEVGRADAMRTLGMTYREMEERGVVMPIATMVSKYIRPALYDDLLTVRTIIKSVPGARMHFFYEIYNEEGVLLNLGETVLAFIKKDTGRPCAAPDWFLEPLIKAFEKTEHQQQPADREPGN
jgi:acyl-CoA thioester hydrolase